MSPRAVHPTAQRIAQQWPQKYRTLNAFRKALVTGWPTIMRAVKEDLPPNHPLLPKIAADLEIPLPVLIEGNTAEPLTPGKLSTVNAQMGRAGEKRPRGKAKRAEKKPGTTMVHVPRERTIHAMSKTALRKLDPKALQLARTLATSTNVQIMQGKAYLSLPNMPVDALALLLADYFQAKGVPGVMILNPDYAEIFG